MARILVTAAPLAGHVAPISGVAEALDRRGHEVVAYTSSKYGPRFERAGATALPWSEAPDFDDERMPETFPPAGRPGMAGLFANLVHVFIRTGRADCRSRGGACRGADRASALIEGLLAPR